MDGVELSVICEKASYHGRKAMHDFTSFEEKIRAVALVRLTTRS